MLHAKDSLLNSILLVSISLGPQTMNRGPGTRDQGLGTSDLVTFFLNVPGEGTTVGEETNSSLPMLGWFQALEFTSKVHCRPASIGASMLRNFHHHLWSTSQPMCMHEESLFFPFFPLTAATMKEHP